MIIHPTKGFLILEVKGITRLNIKGGIWHAPTYKMPDPYKKQQANQNALALFLKKRFPEMQGKWYCYCFGICFTEFKKDDYNLGPIASNSNTIFSNELNSIESKINEIYQSSSLSSNRATLSDKLISKITDLIAPTTQIRKPLSSVFKDQENKFIKLTSDQRKIVEATYGSNRPIIVYGPAGSGKTQIAISQTIDDLKSESKVLFITNTEELSQNIKRQLTINILNFDNFRNSFVIYTVKERQLIEKIKKFISDNKEDEIRIIIDESQTLKDFILEEIINLVDSNRKVQLLLFRDESQKSKLELQQIPQSIPIFLNEIIRNTKEVFDNFKEYIDETYKIVPPQAKSEKQPKKIICNDKKILIENIIKDVYDLLKEGAEGKEITILFDRYIKSDEDIFVQLKKSFDINNYKFEKVDCLRPVHNKTITYSSVWEFQGLENHIIFFVELKQSLTENVILKRVRYTGRSRAISILNLYSLSPEQAQIEYSTLFQ